MLSKTDLARKIADRYSMSISKATDLVNSVFNTITDSLAHGEEVRLTGFGTFRVSERAERRTRNPRTGEPMIVPAGRRPSFSAGSRLVEAVRGEQRKAA